MRFLVFNLVVFLSIGYLFTAAPGQSVGHWLDNTIGSFNQETTAIKTAELDKKPDVLLSTKLKPHNHPDPMKSSVQSSGKLSSGEHSNQITAEKIQKTINDAINANLRQIVASLHLAENQSLDSVKSDPVVTMTTSTEATQVKPVQTLPDTSKSPGSVVSKTVELAKKPLKQTIENSDKALAQGFRELYSADTIVPTIGDNNLPSNEKQPTLKFMTPNDRQTALSELIQNLQLTYVTRAGD